MALPAALLDIDGTLVDTNYHHTLSWFRALREHGAVVPAWRIHRHIGMGGDKIVAAVTNDHFESHYGDEVRATEGELYAEMLDEVEPLPGARELVRELHERGHPVVLASSAKPEEVEHYVELLDIGQLIDGYSTGADVQRTKPDTDIIQAALARIGARNGNGSGRSAVMIGDSIWDCKAARRAGIASIGLLTGGFCSEELRSAGAAQVLENAEELRRELGKTPLTA